MKILFVCTGNTCRSPMAEAIFRKIAEERKINIDIQSAGISAFTGTPASSNAVEALKEKDIDLTSFRSTALTALLPVISEFDLFVPMTQTHAMTLLSLGIEKSKIYLFKNSVYDPYGGTIDTYRRTRDQLKAELETLADFVEEKINDSGNRRNDS